MINIRLIGTRDELKSALSMTRAGYNVLARSKPHKTKADSLRWSIAIKAELKPITTDLQIPLPATQTERQLDDRIEAQMEDEGNRRV